MTEQRYKAVLAVNANGRTVTEVARDWGVSRQTMRQWLGRCEDEVLEAQELATIGRPMSWMIRRAISYVPINELSLRLQRPQIGSSQREETR